MKIDYELLGDAVGRYDDLGYKYVEVPWLVAEDHIRATLPDRYPFVVTESSADLGGFPILNPTHNALVGSAEQGFLSLDLAPGKYMGVTPCFRFEEHLDIFHQPYFMKLELFDTRPAATVRDVVSDALVVQSNLLGWIDDDLVIKTVQTAEGVDLQIEDVEIGSYGQREWSPFGSWVYGTGLALPRFSVAAGVASLR